ncbi:PhoH family protein [Pollutimonas thiosulfatoxidans]|uniref:Ribonuclease n=1 Tax=Pollutimonas thiosulfatoxidans TaxID=2028345 RepID=A0A410GBU0_9BURK|nr:PhoH family protein [Pollutimonas thiosulfatoxidans]MBF6615168.1 PhoH family protein [Candidimonas sp.]NYT44724.1 PhoH family protein [Alcaligenaceae bacterium]QAA93762.1 ribonuclease [Pollutimonas thiosulfatoxidans]
MPLPKLPTRMGAVISADTGSEPVVAEDAATPAPTPAAKAPRSKAPAAAPAARKTAKPLLPATPPPPEPALTVVTSRPAKKARLATAKRKLFVLDTNVLLHDSNSLFKFQEHDIFLPMMVLEELDHQKKGMSEVARNARQVSRFLDGLVSGNGELEKGVELDTLGNQEALGRLHFQTTALYAKLPIELPMGKADNAILNVVHALQAAYSKREVILVSKDINMRLKARSLGLPAEDYLNDHVLDDSDLLYDGVMPLPENFWLKHGKDVESWQQGGTTFYRIKGPLCAEFIVNEFVYFDGDLPLQAQVKEVSGKSAVLATLRDYSHGKNNVWGITARNREQNFALNLLMNPDCDFVSLLGQAGTGKTLLALASALTQTLETKRYNEIIITRATVPVGDDIGFLPGTEEEKMLPWMGALEDNLEVLHLGAGNGEITASGGNVDWSKNTTMELIRSRIKVKSLNFMRGRTFLNKFLIIDEAQNLTPKQMKTLVTRAGPGTKIVCLGNIAQIDTPYLTEGSSGLTYVVDRFKGWPHAGHITLQRGERSRLADYASEAL